MPDFRKKIEEIADRVREQRDMIPRGEGGERRLRFWLAHEVFINLFGWSSSRVQFGERFDILLLDDKELPIIYVETKDIGHTPTKKDQKDFIARLSIYPSLRHAFLTNLEYWLRVDLVSPNGIQKITGQDEYVDIFNSLFEDVEKVLDPLRVGPDRIDEVRPIVNQQLDLFDFIQSSDIILDIKQTGYRKYRRAIWREYPEGFEVFSRQVSKEIADLAAIFVKRFELFRAGSIGREVKEITILLFERWCEQSLTPKPTRVLDEIMKSMRSSANLLDAATKTCASLGFPKGSASGGAEILAAKFRSGQSIGLDDEGIWKLYESSIVKMAAQAAHVTVARLLLYRIAEDQGVWPVRVSGGPLLSSLEDSKQAATIKMSPATQLYLSLRRDLEDVFPTLYRLGEFDFWLVPDEKKMLMDLEARSSLRPLEVELEGRFSSILQTLDGFVFAEMDVDLWQEIYQHFLPDEERQRLGGFYTPREIVEFDLDMAGYIPASEGLCQKTFLDPASGSGAFVVGAISRLLAHLEMDLPCHAELRDKGIPVWTRAESICRIVMSNTHAVDVHPFAAFLTTLNALFSLLSYYLIAKGRNPDFSLNLSIFCADTLEKPEEQQIEPDILEKLNSRIQLAADSLARFRATAGKRYDFVFGNPPWGGVLKGPLAPVYDELKKRRFKLEFPAAAQGKYDVYGLFLERASQLVTTGGFIGFITQDTYLEKEWAEKLFAEIARILPFRLIASLNPFGQLFFGAMNTPCVTVAGGSMNGETDKRDTIVVRSFKPESMKTLGSTEREQRHQVLETLRRAIELIRLGQKQATVDFVKAWAVKADDFALKGGRRFAVTPDALAIEVGGGRTLADVLEPFQGVTPGGALEIFLLRKEKADALGLESDITYPAIKSRELKRWRVGESNLRLLYPYVFSKQQGMSPAFSLSSKNCATNLKDALDFDTSVDEREKAIIREMGVGQESRKAILSHRSALGMIPFPKAAEYLISYYDQLSGRAFEKKNIQEQRIGGKLWYEYHRPRKTHNLLSRPCLLSPRLIRKPKFAICKDRLLSDDACIFLIPTIKTATCFAELKKKLVAVLGRVTTEDEVFYYLLAWANSPISERILKGSRLPTPKGSYQVTEVYLREVPIPDPSPETASAVIDIVGRLTAGKEDADENALFALLDKT